jgi:chromosome segregation ATPase
MKREELKKLELTPEQIDAVMDLNGTDVNGLKAEVNTLTATKDELATQVSAFEEQIKGLSDANKGNDDLQTQLEQVKTELAEKDTQAKTNIESIKRDYEVQLKLQSVGARNIKAVSALLDNDSIKFDKDGKIEGLDEQLEAIQKDNEYLFQASEQASGTERKLTVEGNATPPAAGNDAVQAQINEGLGIK